MLARARVLVCAIGVAAGLILAACGGGGGVSSDDPASLAPADAPIYIQATIRPKGKLKTHVEALASTVSGIDDPTARLIALLDESASIGNTRDPTFNYADDIEPWLGQRAGLFVEGFTDDPAAAAIVQTTDAAAAKKAVKDGSETDDKESSYKGADYVLDPDGTAAGVIDDFFVIGNESAFKDVVDVSNGGDSLGDEGEFTDTIDEASSGSILDAYVSVEAATEAIRADDPDNAKAVETSIGDTSGKTVLASLVPSSDSLELDAITNVDQNFITGDLKQLIGGFPADSFAAIGIPDLAGQVERTLDQLEKSGIEGVTRRAIDQQLAAAGLSLDDITAALGDLGVFAQGTDRQSLQGAGVIASNDPNAAEKLLSKLTGLVLITGQSGISKAPFGTGFSLRDPADLGRQPLIITTEGGKIAIGYGEQATQQALSGGGSTLADDPTFKQALAGLGGSGVSGYVALPAVFRLADSLGALTDPDYQQVRPYLGRLSYLIFGSGKQGDFSSSKVIVGVRR
jgi:hypothetical protein